MKISELPIAGPLSGSEEIAVTQDGVSKKVYANQFSATGAVADHEAKLDPHPQYLNDARGDIRYIKKTEAGIPNGVAPLDETGKVGIEYLPDLPAGRKVIVADEAERLALPIHNDLTIAYQQSDSTVWGLNSSTNPAVPENWQFLGSTAVDGVVTFNGRAGVVVPAIGDYDADQIAETTKKFVTDLEKSGWDAKLDETSADILYVRKDQFVEETQDTISTTIVAGTNVTTVYDDDAGTLTINATGGSGAVDSVNGLTGVVVLDAASVGADVAGAAEAAVDAHELELDPHTQYLNETRADAIYARQDTLADSVMDVVGTQVVAGANVSLDYDALTHQLTVNATAGSGAVDSVNGQTGVVVLTASDVGAAEEIHAHVSTDITDFNEAVQDVVSTTIVAGTNVTTSYDDELGTLTINATGGAGAVDSVNGQTGVVVLDAADVGAAEAIHTHVSADITDLTEVVQDTISTTIVAGTNVTATYDDELGTLTIAAELESAVDSVNGQTGVVVLSNTDVGAAATVHTHVSSDVTDFEESAVVAVSDNLVAGQNIDISYSTTTKKITIEDQGNDSLMIWQGI